MRGGFGFALVLVMAPSPCCCAPRPWPADAASRSSAEVGREGKRGWPERVARGSCRAPEGGYETLPGAYRYDHFVRLFVHFVRLFVADNRWRRRTSVSSKPENSRK